MKTVFTTGEAADLCNVSQQTIIRCFDAGRLKGFRVPGSKFRRIPREALLAFMRQNEMPTAVLDGQANGDVHAAKPPGNGGRTRVLIVDDDPEIVELFQAVLDQDGDFETATARTGYDAGLLTGEFRPDVILLDYMLPDVNGNVVCRTVKAKPGFGDTRIILISGRADDEAVAELRAAGADAFVQKPLDVSSLVGTIRDVLARA